MANILAQHPPAVKVGGRRLSISAKHKPHTNSESAPVQEISAPENIDYPRPAAPGNEQTHHSNPPHTEEEIPLKKEKKHENGLKLKELAHRKAENTRPSRDVLGGKGGFGGAGRVLQPAGKGLAI